MSSSTTSHEAERQLDAGHLSRRSLLSLALASFIPAVGMGLLPVLMLSLAGPTAWASAMITAVLVICVGRSVVVFARRYVGTGSLYSYIGYVFGPWARYLMAAALLAGFIAQVAAISATIGIFGGSFLDGRGVENSLAPVTQVAIMAVAILIAAIIAYRGVDTSVRVAVTLAALSVPLMVVITIASALHTGLDLSAQFDMQQFSVAGALQGVAAGAAWLIGFESCTSMAAETKDPTRNVPAAVMSVPLILGATYLFTTILQVPGLIAASSDLEAGMSAPAALALQGGLGSGVAAATDLVLAVACFAALIGFVNYGARCALAIGEDGLLPTWSTRVHKRFKSPSLAVIAITVTGFIVITALLVGTGDITTAYSMAAPLIVYCWIGPYVLISVGALVLAARKRERTAFTVIAAIVGGAGMTWTYLNGWINPPPPYHRRTRWSGSPFSSSPSSRSASHSGIAAPTPSPHPTASQTELNTTDAYPVSPAATPAQRRHPMSSCSAAG